MAGSLYVVATPIGNLGDITIRALETLKKVDLIVCEDTRTTIKLLSRYQIKKPMISFFKGCNPSRVEGVIEALKGGKDVALVSESGTPCVSDPGAHVLARVLQERVKVIAIPGSSAVSAAASVSGFYMDRFIFEGFLPKKRSKRLKIIESFKDQDRSIIIFESPHRISRTLNEILSVLGDRPCTIARELTKIHEEIKHGKLSELLSGMQMNQRGEFTIIVSGRL